MRILLIYNPTAGDDDVEPAELVLELEAAGHEVVSRSVKKDGWEQTLAADFDLVVAAGGDGTVVKVFKQLAGTDIPATLFPIGSANNIAGSLGFEDVDLRRLIQESAEAWLDIGSIAWDGGRERFVESAGGGLFAEMIARADELPKPNGEDKVDFGLRLLREIVNEAEPQHWHLRADGEDRSGDFLAVEAMNVRQLGPNVPLAPDADPGDGLLDLVLVRDADRSALAAYLDARSSRDQPSSRSSRPTVFGRSRSRRRIVPVFTATTSSSRSSPAGSPSASAPGCGCSRPERGSRVETSCLTVRR